MVARYGAARLLGLLLILLAAAAPARAEWIRAESPNFILYSQNREDRVRQQVAQLEDFRDLLHQLTGAPAPSPETAPRKLAIYMVRGHGDMIRVRNVGRGVGGFYSASPEGLVAVVDESFRQDWMTHTEVLFHEYAHHFMLQYFPASYPLWYVEGFAEYVATARMSEDRLEFGRSNPARASWLADRSGWLRLDRLLFEDPSRFTGVEGAKFYAQSWLLVHYMMSDAGRRRQLASYLAAVAAGAEARGAFAQAFGTTPSALQIELSRYGARELSFSRVARRSASVPVSVTLTSLGPWADALLLEGAAIKAARQDDPQAFIRQLRRRAEGHGNPEARRILAHGEALYGDPAAAEALLEPLLATAPDDAELLYFKGLAHLARGRSDESGRRAHFAEARRWFARAHRADDNHFPTLFRFAESLSAEPDFLSENTRNVMILAHQLGPQVDEIAYATAILLLRRGEYDDAEAMLAPLAGRPHRGPFAEQVSALLEKARARDNRDLPGMFDFPTEQRRR